MPAPYRHPQPAAGPCQPRARRPWRPGPSGRAPRTPAAGSIGSFVSRFVMTTTYASGGPPPPDPALADRAWRVDPTRIAVRILILLATLWLIHVPRIDAAESTSIQRIVSVEGSITEILFALGAADRVVAVDSTSQHPRAARDLPQVGYLRALSAEGILAQRPQLVLMTEDAGPPAVITQLRDAGLDLQSISNRFDIDGVVEKIQAVAALIGAESPARRLVDGLREQWAERRPQLPATAPARVLFLLSAGTGPLLASGSDTAADSIVRLSGHRNAVHGFSGYKPIAAEALLASDPDVILMSTRSYEIAGGLSGLSRAPGLAALPDLERRVVTLDGMLMLGFGPRVVEAALAIDAAIARNLAGRSAVTTGSGRR